MIARLHANESGQFMVVFVMFLAIFLGFMGLVIDGADFMLDRRRVQNAVDAAALAAAQDLPASGTDATDTATTYMAANAPDVPAGNLSTSFRCIVGDRDNNNTPDASDIPAACDPGTGTSWTCQGGLCYSLCDPSQTGRKCNTIVVSASKQVPFYFAPALKVLTNGTECIYDECSTGTIKAAACRGACGLTFSAPLDVMIVLDRTSSMTSTDLANAKAGAQSVLSLYNPAQQHIGLAVLGPNLNGSSCNSVDYDVTRAQMVWRPVGLSSDYKNVDGTVNTASSLYSTIDCLGFSGVRTNLGEAMRAAMNELINNGRSGVSKGIIFFTDGEANRWDSNDTGWLNCSANAAVTSSAGDNNGFQTSASNACAKDGSNAQDTNSGTGTSTDCSNSGKDRHIFRDYNISIPSGSPITGIEVDVTARADSTSGDPDMCIQLSWNGGSNWTSSQSVDLSSSLTSNVLGAPYDTWGHSWSVSEFSNANFRVRVSNEASDNNRDFYLDYIGVRVFYNDGNPTSLGACDYLVDLAATAKAQTPPIEVFTIGLGVQGAVCNDDLSSSPYDGAYATTSLADAATLSSDDNNNCLTASDRTAENADGDHFFCEASADQLTSLFQAAAVTLAGSGSKLMNVPF
jgi:hypothetical protein